MRCRALGAGQDLKEFDVDNAYGLAALKRILDDCVGNTLHMEAVKVSEGFLSTSAMHGRPHPPPCVLQRIPAVQVCRGRKTLPLILCYRAYLSLLPVTSEWPRCMLRLRATSDLEEPWLNSPAGRKGQRLTVSPTRELLCSCQSSQPACAKIPQLSRLMMSFTST